jgi:hypothetical protein
VRRGAPFVAILLLSAFLLWQVAASSAFKYPDFSSKRGLKLNGDAHKAGDVIRLTDNVPSQAGSVFTKRKRVDLTKSFKTQFTFMVHDGVGDGIAFVLQREGKDALGAGGGGLGYSGIDHSSEVEFDTFNNPEASDPSGNHMAIMKNGNTGNHLDVANPPFSLVGPKIHVWIQYSANSHKLKGFVNDAPNRPPPDSVHSVSFEQNLKNIVGSKAFAGFTGGCGNAAADQDILSWKLTQ